MFKSARWRSDKSKIKAVFKLQFHATQLAATGGDALTVAVIPSDVGKPTARLEKTKVKDGSCYWEKPHFETVKFTQDHKTGKINEKIYRFIVATGTSVFGVAGEASLDFSKYSDAAKAASLSLPLKYAKSSSVLHVSIQRVQDQREVNESENVDEDNKGHVSNGDAEESLQSDSVEQDHEVLTDNISRDHGASSVSDITLSGSDSSSGLDTPWEAEPKDTKRDWLDGSVHELSTDEEGSPDDVIKKLKGELVILARQAEVSEMEIQTLRKQIVKESKRSQDLSKEVIALKEERNELKEECEKMKVKVKVNNKLLTEGGDSLALVDELRQELNYEKDLNSNLRLQLQKTQESNAELILAVRDLDEMLESKSKCQEVNDKPETDDEDQKALEDIVKQHSGMKDAYLQEQKIIDLYNEIELYKRDKDELETQMEHIALDYEILKQENHDLSYKLEQSQLQEQLKMQYECSTSYATVTELESQIENLHNELKSKSDSIQELETQVKNLEEELSKQAERFEADTEEMIRAKVEQEQRAIQAEETLRKVKLQNASTAGKLQEEFRKLSIQMTSAFRGNENAAMKAMDEAVQLRIEKKHLEEILKKVKQEFDHLGNQYEDKMADLSNQLTLKSKQVENLSQELTHQKASYNAMIEDLDGELSDREIEIRLVKVELESLENEVKDLKKVKTEKDNEVERLQIEIERLKSRCNDMKQFCKENELEKDNMKKQLVQLKGDLKKKDEAIASIEKRVKEGSKPTPRNNNKSAPVSRSPKEVNNMKDKVKLLENQINLKEIALERAEAAFLEKEKDLKLKIEDLERRVADLDQNIENPQVSTAESPNPAIGPDGDEKTFKASPDVTELLNKNKCMEVELKEMQERYSEISLKFAEVEGERQQLVMSLRNLKNAKLMVQR